MSDETVAVELTERQLRWIDDAIRWQKEAAEENGRKRSAQKLKRAREPIQSAKEEHL